MEIPTTTTPRTSNTFAETLSEAEAQTITNYNDLFLEFYADVP